MDETTNKTTNPQFNQPAKQDKKSSKVKKVLITFLVFLLIVGGPIAVYVWQQQEIKSQQQEITDLNKQLLDISKAQSESQAEKAPNESEETNFLVIKEWGIKIPLNDKLKGAYYKIEDVNNGVRTSIAHLYVDISKDFKLQCMERAQVNKVSEQDVLADYWGGPKVHSQYATKIGKYYYSIQGSESPCSDDEKIQKQADTIELEWLNQKKSIVATN